MTNNTISNNNAMVKVFENEQFGQVRTVIVDNEPWFVAVDVCKALELVNSRKATDRLDADEKAAVTLSDTSSNGTIQNRCMTIVNEAGLYVLVLSSRKPEAKQFKRWVTHDILPTLRKTGTYSLNGEQVALPHDFESALEMLLKQVRVTKEQAVKIDTLTTEVAALSNEKLTWNDPAVFTALVRKYAFTRCGGDWAGAYNKVYKQLQYKHSISLKKRRAADVKKNPDKPEKPLSKYLKEKELPLAISTIIAMCEDSKVAIDDILRDKNLTALTVC